MFHQSSKKYGQHEVFSTCFDACKIFESDDNDNLFDCLSTLEG